MDYTIHLSKDKKLKQLISENEAFTLKKKRIFAFICALQ